MRAEGSHVTQATGWPGAWPENVRVGCACRCVRLVPGTLRAAVASAHVPSHRHALQSSAGPTGRAGGRLAVAAVGRRGGRGAATPAAWVVACRSLCGAGAAGGCAGLGGLARPAGRTTAAWRGHGLRRCAGRFCADGPACKPLCRRGAEPCAGGAGHSGHRCRRRHAPAHGRRAAAAPGGGIRQPGRSARATPRMDRPGLVPRRSAGGAGPGATAAPAPAAARRGAMADGGAPEGAARCAQSARI